MTPSWSVERVGKVDDQQVDELAGVLIDCVEEGQGRALMQAAEVAARDSGKTLLVLDTVTDGDAARLYERLGWVRVGDIPCYSLLPQGGLSSTTVFYRNLDLSLDPSSASSLVENPQPG